MRMTDVLMRCVMTGNGRQTFTGLFNENGFPVKVMIRKDDEDVVLSIIYDDEEDIPRRDQPRDCGISEEEIDRVCKEHDDCDTCPLSEYCNEVFGDEDEDEDYMDSPERTEYNETRC